MTAGDVTASDVTASDSTAKNAAAKKVATLSASLIALKHEASPEGFAHPFHHPTQPQPPPTAITSLLNSAGRMLPLAIVLVVLNLLLMLTWLAWETTMKTGGETVVTDTDLSNTDLSNTGAITAAGTVNHVSPGTPPRPSSDDVPLERKAPDDSAAPPPPEAPSAGGQTATDITPQPQSQPEPQPESRFKPQFHAKPQSKPPVPAKFLALSGKPGYRVQIFALASDAAVRKAWPRLQKAHPDLLGGLKLKVVRTSRGPRKGIVYRLQAGTLSSAATARKLCDRLRKRKLDCIIVRS